MFKYFFKYLARCFPNCVQEMFITEKIVNWCQKKKNFVSKNVCELLQAVQPRKSPHVPVVTCFERLSVKKNSSISWDQVLSSRVCGTSSPTEPCLRSG